MHQVHCIVNFQGDMPPANLNINNNRSTLTLEEPERGRHADAIKQWPCKLSQTAFLRYDALSTATVTSALNDRFAVCPFQDIIVKVAPRVLYVKLIAAGVLL